jgi:hypothetical protein
MQTISLGEEIELIDGIPYDIDFYQDFSDICLNRQQITDMPVAAIIEFLNNNGVKTFDCNVPMGYMGEEYESSRVFWEALDKYEKEERKRKKKWKKGKAKRKAHVKRVLNWLDDFDSLLKERW